MISAFVGRETELAALAKAYATGERILTLTGPVGVGKSRLAAEWLKRAAGGLLCDVSDAVDREGVAAAVAGTLGVTHGSPASSVAFALEALGSTTLVLDGFDRVQDGGGLLEEWCHAAPEVRFVVTSRERLRLSNERVVEVGPLELPTPEAPMEAESVRFLLARARRIRQGFTVDADQTQDIAEIARRLDGIPLALEIAAPRLVLLGARTLLERLDDRFEMLGRRRGAFYRAIACSWEMLDDAERSVLAQCSVFRGGFDLDAAEAVVEPPPGAAVLDALQGLFDKSLIRVASDGRFDLLLSIRDFASEHLTDPSATRRRHAAYYAALGERLAAKLRGPGATDAWRELGLEAENLKAAARACLGDVSGRAAIALGPVMAAQGPYAEYADILTGVLASRPSAETEVLVRGLRGDAFRFLGQIEAEHPRARSCRDPRARHW